MTQSLLAGAVLGLYFGGIGVVKLMGRWCRITHDF
jgi:sec-independent protein translocase protein TatC